MKAKWYAPGQVTLKTREQVFWVLRHLLYIREGWWPSEHRETGYYYLGGTGGQPGHHASYEAAVMVAAELERRLEKCDFDGIMLEYLYIMDTEDRPGLAQKLSNYLHMTIKEVYLHTEDALSYCIGARAKTISYHRHQIVRRYRTKQKIGATPPPSGEFIAPKS